MQKIVNCNGFLSNDVNHNHLDTKLACYKNETSPKKIFPILILEHIFIDRFLKAGKLRQMQAQWCETCTPGRPTLAQLYYRRYWCLLCILFFQHFILFCYILVCF